MVRAIVSRSQRRILLTLRFAVIQRLRKLLLPVWSGTTGIQHQESRCPHKGMPWGYHQTSIYLCSQGKTNAFCSLTVFPNLSQNLTDGILGNVVLSFLVPMNHRKGFDQRFPNHPTSGKAEFMVQVQPRQKEICKYLGLTTETPNESCFRRKNHVSGLHTML